MSDDEYNAQVSQLLDEIEEILAALIGLTRDMRETIERENWAVWDVTVS